MLLVGRPGTAEVGRKCSFSDREYKLRLKEKERPSRLVGAYLGSHETGNNDQKQSLPRVFAPSTPRVLWLTVF